MTWRVSASDILKGLAQLQVSEHDEARRLGLPVFEEHSLIGPAPPFAEWIEDHALIDAERQEPGR